MCDDIVESSDNLSSLVNDGYAVVEHVSDLPGCFIFPTGKVDTNSGNWENGLSEFQVDTLQKTSECGGCLYNFKCDTDQVCPTP